MIFTKNSQTSTPTHIRQMPTLTPHHFLVLKFLDASKLVAVPGSDLRSQISEYMHLSRPSFYQLMKRMENIKLVKGESIITDPSLGGHERRYKSTRNGQKQYELTLQFYSRT